MNKNHEGNKNHEFKINIYDFRLLAVFILRVSIVLLLCEALDFNNEDIFKST